MFRRILVWAVGTLLFSFTGYVLTSIWVSSHSVTGQQDSFRRTVRYFFEEAVAAYESGGAAALQATLARQHRSFPGFHHLLDANGVDLATGKDLSGLLAKATEPRFEFPPPKRSIRRFTWPDGRYTFLMEIVIPNDPLANLFVYGWIVVVVIVLLYARAATLARPIRQLHDIVVRFGGGDLSSRSRSTRNDEIGDLARAFDQMADRIETLLNAERRLLQDVSHELRSPLARLRFALQLARSSADPKAALARVDKEVDRLATLVGELLQVTRAEGDPDSRNISAIELGEFLTALVEDCKIEAHARGCEIDLHAPGRMLWAGDRELLHRAIENIVRNAVHHAPGGSKVDVELTADGTDAVIRVRDFGQGVPEEHLLSIFRPFYRVEEDRNRNNGGVGLGLAIAKRAVAAHNGGIRAVNADPGLMIEVRLPK
jgi:signal transduction histidine kinase